MTDQGECDDGGGGSSNTAQNMAEETQDSVRKSRTIKCRPAQSTSLDQSAATKSQAQPSLGMSSITAKSKMFPNISPSERELDARHDDLRSTETTSETGPPLLEDGFERSAPQAEDSRPPGDDTDLEGHRPSEEIVIPPCISEVHVHALRYAILNPPVTKDSLEELDLIWIQSNPNLRIDINFDHDLHFTPISGDKGEKKKQEAEMYYLALVVELVILYQHGPATTCAACKDAIAFGSDKRVFKRRLPALFKVLKELLVTLVPERDRSQISEFIDIALLLQEASNGLLDIVRLARWLSGLLTSHCAPIRDASAHEMAEQIRQGAESGDVHALVAGIQKLFVFLEAMKLDVANHQIRTIRYFLIDDTVAFQQELFQAQVKQGSLAVGPSRSWHHGCMQKHAECRIDRQTPRTSHMGGLIHGFLELCLLPDQDLPATLAYDHKRLKDIGVDIQDIVHLEISLSIFDQLIKSQSSAAVSPGSRRVAEGARATERDLLLSTRIMDLTDGTTEPDLSMQEVWSRHVFDIALELNRAASRVLRVSSSALSDDLISQTTRRLEEEFDRERDSQSYTRRLARSLEQIAHDHASRFQNMTTLAISQEQRHWQQARARSQQSRSLPGPEDIARRLAHIAAIHWRVWADIVYLDEEEPGVGEGATVRCDMGREEDLCGLGVPA